MREVVPALLVEMRSPDWRNRQGAEAGQPRNIRIYIDAKSQEKTFEITHVKEKGARPPFRDGRRAMPELRRAQAITPCVLQMRVLPRPSGSRNEGRIVAGVGPVLPAFGQ